MARSNYIVRGGGDFSGLYKELNEAQKRMNHFKSGMGKVLKGVAGLFGGLALGGLAKDFANTAMRTETLEVAMLSVGRASGYAAKELDDAKKAIRDKGIAEQESMQILTRFMQAQLDVADASKLARVAQDAAVIANVNSSEAAEQMTEAIAKQRPELLSAFGMTKNLNVVLSEYASTLGLAAKDLDEAQRKQAMLNYILTEGAKIAGTYEASMDAVGKKIGSLPRHYQDLQNAIATPLMLPGIGVAVDAITNALQRATAWADANSMTLQYWGQVVANAVGGVVHVFSWLTNVLSQNWSMIQFVGGAMLAYAAITRTVALVTQLMAFSSALLNGTLVTKVPLLAALSGLMAQYKIQTVLSAGAMVTAGGASGVLANGLLMVRNALAAVHAVLGPVGWMLMAISALLGLGTVAWGKYSSSVMKSNQSIKSTKPDMSSYTDSMKVAQKSLGDMGKGANKAGKAQKKLGKDIKKAGKEAKGSVAGFDEINSLQDNMADTDLGGLEDMGDLGGAGGGGVPDIGGIPDFGGFGDMGGIPDMGLGGLMDDLDMAKPTLKGFWEFIKQGFSKAWEKVKEYWSKFVEWFKGTKLGQWLQEAWTSTKEWFSNFWEGVKEKWSAFKEWVPETFSNIWEGIKNTWSKFTTWASDLWEGVKTKWNEFTTWVKGLFSKLWEGIKNTWNKFTTWTSKMWEATKTKWNEFTSWVSNLFSKLWEGIKKTWDKFTTWTSKMWENTKEKWDTFTTWVSDIFSKIWESIKKTWNNFTTWASNMWDSTKAKWNEFKEDTKRVFGEMWTSIKETFSNTKTWFGDTFGGAWEKIKEVFSIDNIRAHFNNALTTIKNVFNNIPEWFRTKFTKAWTNVKNVFSTGGKIFTGIKDGIAATFKTIVNGLISGINRIIKVPFNAINGMLNTIRNVSIMGVTPFSGFITHNAISTPQIPHLAKGGITNGEMLAVVGDNPGGREVVSPLDTLQDMLINAVGTAMLQNDTGGNRETVELVVNLDSKVIARTTYDPLENERVRRGPSPMQRY